MARRRFQRGSVFLRGKEDQKWVGRWREDVVMPDGTVRSERRATILCTRAELPTKRLAQRRLELILARVNAPEYRPGRVANISEFADRWVIEVLAHRKPSSIRAAQSHLRNQIIPYLGKLPLSELSHERQQTFVTQISRKISRKSVLNVLSTLSSMIKTSRKWGYIAAPVKISELVLPAEQVKTEARFFHPGEVRKILALAREPFRTMFLTAALTGLRAGELLGLKVDDVDFEHRLIFVRRSVIRGRVQTVKSKASAKPVPLPAVLAQVLKRHLSAWRENPERWVFANRRSRPYAADKVVLQGLWPVLDQLGIPHCGLHAFRHFTATMLMELGASPQTTQAQMRHSDPRITLETYSHVINESQRNAVEKLADILAPNGLTQDDLGEWIQ